MKNVYLKGISIYMKYKNELTTTYVKQKYFPCVIDVNECENSPCHNKGSCVNSDGSYACICTKGWQGYNCEEGNIFCNRADHKNI